MSDEHNAHLRPTGVQIVSLPTPEHVQRAISDAFTRTASELTTQYQLEPRQIVAGLTRFIWDFAQRHAKWGTLQLGQYSIEAWKAFEQKGMFNARPKG